MNRRHGLNFMFPLHWAGDAKTIVMACAGVGASERFEQSSLSGANIAPRALADQRWLRIKRQPYTAAARHRADGPFFEVQHVQLLDLKSIFGAPPGAYSSSLAVELRLFGAVQRELKMIDCSSYADKCRSTAWDFAHAVASMGEVRSAKTPLMFDAIRGL